MINGIDFSVDYPTKVALVTCALFPIILMIITKIPRLAGRNALQFLLNYFITTIVWIGALGFFVQKTMPISFESLCVSFFLYNGVMLGYLEIWGLLSRGYTLGILLTFYKANAPLNPDELANLYRGGEGLAWLIKHRFSGLASAKMIKLQNNRVVLTTRGIIIAYLYKLSVWFFGLRYTG